MKARARRASSCAPDHSKSMTSDPALSFGFVDGHPVFMDERSDSYFRLEDEAETEFLEFIRSDGTLSASASAGLRAALGSSECPPAVVLAQAPAIRRSLLDEPGSRGRIRDALIVAKLLKRTRSSIA